MPEVCRESRMRNDSEKMEQATTAEEINWPQRLKRTSVNTFWRLWRRGLYIVRELVIRFSI